MMVSRKNEKQYLAFDNQEYVFAAPIENIESLIPVDEKIPYTIPPHIPKHVLCVMNPYGQFITVIDLLRLFGLQFGQESAKMIVILKHAGTHFGVPSQDAYIVSALADEISEDAMTGAKVFFRDERQISILDIPRLCEYICDTHV